MLFRNPLELVTFIHGSSVQAGTMVVFLISKDRYDTQIKIGRIQALLPQKRSQDQ